MLTAIIILRFHHHLQKQSLVNDESVTTEHSLKAVILWV